jgi:hypothetical protein
MVIMVDELDSCPMLTKRSCNISVPAFYREFEHRHEFDSDDIRLLQTKYPHIRFEGIPEAWVIVIDELVRQVGRLDRTALVAVRQDFGFLSVFRRAGHQYPEIVRELVKLAETRLYLIDVDLHRQLDCKVVA